MPIYPVYPTVGANLVIIAFIVVVLGGMGSVVGALYGGLIIGVVEAVVGYFAGAEAAQVAVLALFLAILLIRPQGIMKAEAA
jgi:branched-chain amino acid transport system permease protein